MTSDCWIAGEHGVTGVAPHRMGGNTHRHIVRSWILGASLVGACGVVLFGAAALRVLAVSVVSAMGADLALVFLTRRPAAGRLPRAALIGLLLGLTLPATADGSIAMLGAIVAIFVGRGVFGGFLHPALVGRVVVQVLFSSLSLSGSLALSPVLAPGHLLVGNLDNAVRLPGVQSWHRVGKYTELDAVESRRPVQLLRKFAHGGIPSDGDLHYEPLMRDVLPPWREALFGVVPGGIGETCGLALIVAGLFLIYRGYVRWQLPVTILVSAALAAAVLPVEFDGSYHWFPALEVEQGRAVGLAYVLYHLTAGQLMLGAFLLAGDAVASPMRVHGQIIFGVGIGVLTIFMRLYGVLEGECYWSILIFNALVGTIDRRMKRRVLGMAVPID